MNSPWEKFERVKILKSRNLRPSKCDVCKTTIGGVGGLTLFHGKWLCVDCQAKAKKE